ncbi:hypothetical protein [Niveibacterium sp. SC-1]|uniref:hypothetical protein n=1 Tax=Niveibacterium sp. SC-1 TaxID=3135646 RepID=UPI00311D4738
MATPDTPIQTNMAQTIFAPMGDLVGKISQPASMRLVLALTPSEELDQRASDNAYFFAARFGFDANTQVREQVLRIQSQHQLTDREIRILKRGKILQIRNQQVSLEHPRSRRISSQVQIVCLSAFAVMMVLALTGIKPSLTQSLIQLGIMVTWAVLTFPVYWFALRPWRVLKDAGLVQ